VEENDYLLEMVRERVIPEISDPGTLAYHLARYEWARQYVKGKEVLDAGCGVGYGSAMLAEDASHVIAVDLEQAAIEYAKRTYDRKNLKFLVMDCTTMGFDDCTFDLVVSFEVFEHISDGQDFVRELCRVLRNDGILVISTPNKITWDLLGPQADYPFHINMITPKLFKKILISSGFAEVEIYGMRKKGTTLYQVLRGLDIFNLRLRLSFTKFEKEYFVTALLGRNETALRSTDILVSRGQIRQCNIVMAICKKL